MERGSHTWELGTYDGGQNEPLHKIESKEHAREREGAFEEVITHKLIDQYFHEMEEAGVSANVLDGLAAKISMQRNTHRLAQILAVPYELRGRLFQHFAEANRSADEILDELSRTVERAPSGALDTPLLGFHTTKNRITPRRVHDALSNSTVTRWDVAGREHSDWSTVPQAYAARSYNDLYREKGVRYLYVVRDSEQNAFDASTGWSHAPGYSIIAEFQLPLVEEEVQKLMSGVESRAA